MKKRRLKKWVKVTLFILAVLLTSKLLELCINNYESKAVKCDNAYGRICTHYEVRQFLIKGE